MILLTYKENKSYEKQKVCYICKKGFSTDALNKKHHEVRDHCHCTRKFRGAAYSICNLKHKTPKEIPIVFQNGSTYDYDFTINKLAKEFDGQLECLYREKYNTGKYMTFSVPTSKELDNQRSKKKQIEALKDLKPEEQTKSAEGIFPKRYENVEVKNEINEIKEYEKKVNRTNKICYSSKEPFDFKTFKTIRSFGENIYSSKITINEAKEEQADLIEYILNFNNKARPKNKNDKKKIKEMFLMLQNIFIRVGN